MVQKGPGAPHAPQTINRRYVISRQNLPARLPVWQSIALFLFFQHYPPVLWWQEFAFGLVAAMLILSWIVEIYCLFTEKQLDIVKMVIHLEQRVGTEKMLNMYHAMLDKCKAEILNTTASRRRHG